MNPLSNRTLQAEQKRWYYFMKAKKFEQQFDDGVDLTASLDLSKGKRVLQEQKRVNVVS